MTPQERLAEAKSRIESAAGSSQYKAWCEQAELCQAFFEGNQWTADEMNAMQDNGQVPIVVNRIAPRVNNLCGTDIQTRTKIKFRSRSAVMNAESMLAEKTKSEALTDLGLYVQERNDASNEFSAVFQTALINGIGWLEVCYEEGKGIVIGWRPYDQFVWDVSDRTRDLSNLRWVARQHVMSRDEAMAKFPDKAEKIKQLPEMISSLRMYENTTSSYADETSTSKSVVWYYDEDSDMVQIWEYQYKLVETKYEATTADGRIISTFDKGEAYRAAVSKDAVSMSKEDRVYSLFFVNDTLLDELELEYQTGEFTYVPFVLRRQQKDGQPYGIVRAAIDSQRAYNKSRSKLLWLMNARQIVMDSDAVEDINRLAQEAARPDGIIVKKAGKEMQFVPNQAEVQYHYAALERNDLDIQAALGIFDESLGVETNAVSGVAIQNRQTGTVRNSASHFDALRRYKRRIGRILLQLMLETFTEEVAFNIIDDMGEVKSIRLNSPILTEDGEVVKDEKGRPLVTNDIRTTNYDVFIDEMPDFNTQMEVVQERVQNMLMNGVQPTQGLLELFGVPKSSRIFKELMAGQGPQVPQGESQSSASPAMQEATAQLPQGA